MNIYEAIAAAGTDGIVSHKIPFSYCTENQLVEVLPGHVDVNYLCTLLSEYHRHWIPTTGWEVVTKGGKNK